MNYTEEFKNTLEYCEKNNLFLGYGNPNGKILMIGKEQYYQSEEILDSKEFYDDLIKKREEVNKVNINSWSKNIEEEFKPDWNSNLNFHLDDSNALMAWWNQKNIQNKRLNQDIWNGGTSNTYLHYQKIYQNVFLNGEKQERINFQKEFFITELNDLLAQKDYKFQILKQLKNNFISERQKMFNNNLPFFKNFPVTIVASGHYGRDFDFNLEKTFDVEWTKETKELDKSWYNLHFSNDNKRMLIHTRQLSTSVSKELINALSDEIKEFLK